jgi:hypothetical protein
VCMCVTECVCVRGGSCISCGDGASDAVVDVQDTTETTKYLENGHGIGVRLLCRKRHQVLL